MASPTEPVFILPSLVELRETGQEQVPESSHHASKSKAFHLMRDRLIQAQWQSDQEHQYRISHQDAALGTLARLPLEVRYQIYRLCFPAECTEDSQIWTKPGSNLIALMQTKRCIYNEIKPLLDRHVQVRVFNLVLGNHYVRFESRQLSVGFLTQQELQDMTSETFLPLGIFTRTLPRIRSLRLVIQMDQIIAPAGLVAALQPFAMWVSSLIARAETLRLLMVDFHVNFNINPATLSKFDSGDMSIGQLIEILLGSKAATHCQNILKQALTSELQVVRLIVYQKPTASHALQKFINSWRWNRPTHPSWSTEAIDRQNQSLLRKTPPQATETVKSGKSPEYSASPPEAGVSRLSKESHPVESTELQESPKYSPPSPAIGKSDGAVEAASRTPEEELFRIDSDVYAKEDESSSSSAVRYDPIAAPSLSSPSPSPEPLIHETNQKSKDATIGIFSHKPPLRSLRATPKELRAVSEKRRSKKQKTKNNEESRYVVKRLLEQKVENGVTYMKVKWQGYQEKTWEPRAQLNEDVPYMVRAFDRHRRKDIYAAEAKAKALRDESAAAGVMARKDHAHPMEESLSLKEAFATPVKAKTKSGTTSPSWQSTQIPTSMSARYTPPSASSIPNSASRPPKKPLPAMALYTQANRGMIAADLCNRLGHPDLVDETKVTTEGARRWLALGSDQRAIWERLHAKRVAAYHIQMEALKAGLPVPSLDEARRMVEERSGRASFMDLT